jgi:hypothetical protein
MADTDTDESGRFVFIVAWGRPGRSDWEAVVALAYDADEARALVSEAYPERFRPPHAFAASAATARSVLTGRPDPTVSHLPVVR